MIEKSKEQVIKELNDSRKKTKLIFWLLILSVVGTLLLTLFELLTSTVGLMISLYFLIMTICLLPKMNKFSFDISKVESEETLIVEGELLAVFPVEETAKEKEWMIMIDTGNKEYVEVEVDSAIGKSLSEGDVVRLNITPFNKIIVELRLIAKIVKQ